MLGVRTLYGLFKGDIFPLAITMLFGQIMAVFYVTIFVLITADRPAAIKLCGLAAVPVVLTSVYAVLAWAGATGQSTPATANVLGYASVLASLCFFSSPFATIRNVIRCKNAGSIPIAMCTAGTIGNSLWTIYGLAISDWFVCLLNLVCVLIGVTQILLYVRYNPNKVSAAETPDADISVLIPSPGKKNQQIGAVTTSFHLLRSPNISSANDPERHV